MLTIGVISDTHGLLRPEAVAALRGVERIIHAGDIGSAEILEQLSQIAPVSAVRGNNDEGPWTHAIPLTQSLQVEGFKIFVLHDRKELQLDPRERGYHVVISGHSHKPSVQQENGVLMLNPGSAGPRRFKLPVSVAKLSGDRNGLKADIIELEVTPPSKRTRR